MNIKSTFRCFVRYVPRLNERRMTTNIFRLTFHSSFTYNPYGFWPPNICVNRGERLFLVFWRFPITSKDEITLNLSLLVKQIDRQFSRKWCGSKMIKGPDSFSIIKRELANVYRPSRMGGWKRMMIHCKRPWRRLFLVRNLLLTPCHSVLFTAVKPGMRLAHLIKWFDPWPRTF